MNLHPYDGVTRPFRHTDPDPTAGLAAVAKLLRLQEPPAAQGLQYEIEFYSGGIGILDHLALSVPTATYPWPTAIAKLNLQSPETAAANPAWSEDFLWLLTLDGDAELPPPRQAAVEFINENRKPFQPACSPTNHIYFQFDSNVNDWLAVWGDDTQLNYLAFSQG